MSEPTRRGFLGLVSAAAITPLVPPSAPQALPDDEDSLIDRFDAEVEMCDASGDVLGQQRTCVRPGFNDLSLVFDMHGAAMARRFERALREGVTIRITVNVWGHWKVKTGQVQIPGAIVENGGTVTLNWPVAIS